MSHAVVFAVIAAAILFALFLERRRRNVEARHRAVRRRSEEARLNEPVSLHPVIDLERCMGSAACVASCPEGKVLGIVDGKATLIQGSRCVGHGRCARECPTGAIRLVFGTAERGVDIPDLTGQFESNVPGLFIVGELGGMGLVRNAVAQGVQAAAHLSGRPRGALPTDVVIVGAGPAGVAAAITCREKGLSVRLLERERSFGGAILHYPREKIISTQPFTVPGFGPVRQPEIPKERMLEILAQALASAGLAPECGKEVSAVRPRPEGGFAVTAAGEEICASFVVLAIGRRGSPRRLEVPGEDLPKVAYGLLEPEVFAGRRVIVVGGGNSAVEAALAVAGQEGAEVTLVHRGESLPRASEANRARLDEQVGAGRVRLLLCSQVLEIAERTVALQTPDGDLGLENDAVLVFVGGLVPGALLDGAGVRVSRKFGQA